LKNIKELCEAGVCWVQLRVKDQSIDKVKALAIDAREICNEHKAVFIMNDHVELAREVDADGVHLGKEDMKPVAARKILGSDKIIGGTANTFEDVQRLVDQEVDYIGLGPYTYTDTKKKLSPVLGIEGYKNILEKCKVKGITTPIVAIGGIVLSDVNNIMNTGVTGIAISGLLTESIVKKELVGQLNELLTTRTIKK